MKPPSVLPLFSLVSVCGCLLLPAPSLADYASEVRADSPLAYFPFQEPSRSATAVNSGSLGAAGNGTNSDTHPVQGALAGSRDGAAYYNGAGARTLVPFLAEMNPVAAESFTVEAWFMPIAETDDAVGPCPLFNRLSAGDRQGWVFFQRSPGTGWNFKMYNGSGDAVGVDLTGQATTPNAGKAGTWNHVVVTWDGPASTATMYVNGQNAGSKTGAYAANAVANARPVSIGAYDTGSNPFRGAVDEVAIYKKLLTPAEILAHYQNGTDAARTVAYDALVKADGPVEYLQLNDASPDAVADVAVNFGAQGAVGNGVHDPAVVRPAAGALTGSVDGSTSFHSKNGGGGGTHTNVEWNAGVNPPASQDFSVEAWFQVGEVVTDAPGPCPLFNRLTSGDRQGWVFFQRSPATGWNFRMYKGTGSDLGVDLTAQATTANAGQLGTWNHVVVTWKAGTSTATMYVNGQNRKTATGTYVANTAENLSSLAIGSYDQGDNAYNGSVDEVAVYGQTLTQAQVSAHYQAGITAAQSAGYARVVLADAPMEYLRLSEPPWQPVVNAGSLGTKANGGMILAVNDSTGPVPPALAGFPATNKAVFFEGGDASVNLAAPTGLNLTGPVTLEAWVRQSGQTGTVNVISHAGSDGLSGALLRINELGEYEVGSIDGNGTHSATSAVPAGDQDGVTWTHLAGTYDGAAWNLYRNGTLLSTSPSTTGAKASTSPWAVGSRGDSRAEAFFGTIDEPAIYGTALSAARIAAHYSAGLAVGVGTSLSIVKNGDGSVTVTYTGVLESAKDLSGFLTVPGAVSPYTIPANALTGRLFFRAR